MPLNDDQNSDSDSSRLSESTASSSDLEYSRQSFNSDSSSKPSSPASASPPKAITFDELMAATRNLSNWTLAHEIAVNANFCIKHEDYPQNSFAGTVKQIVHKAFWDHLESELNEDPPEYEHAIKLFEEIREILLSFLTPGANRIHNQICEVLDTDLIRQQAEHNAVDIPGLANYIINTMGKLCAPIRDNDIKQLKATDNIVELLRQIFRVLDLMKVDMANYTIKSLRPYLWHNLVDYERTKFQEILEETPGALNLTTEWIKESIEDELSSVSDESSSSPGADSSSKPIISPTLVLNNGYLKLLQWDYCKTIPETLITDEVRLQELREKLNQLKIIACVSLITNNMVGAAIVDLPDFADHLKRISLPLLEGMNKKSFDLKEALNAIGIQICSTVNKSLSERGLPTLSEEMQSNLMGQIAHIVEKNNPVCSLIDKRIQLFMRSLLTLPSSQKCMPTVPGGLSVIQTEMELLGSQYASIVNFNKKVYGPFYANILRKLLFPEAAVEKTEAETSSN
ncbi:PREDICTED: T-complex protein 11-like protein 2 isoform X1 [Corvus brachyrhynchos]|nr:PREDICTED: T-complex protein 11-like protein 2 isoform X1 [Corvus brachyrhynchos]XP_017593422.1 PREDICTED: T-complex protein 11-like protein 2 isoform X1 [Corvus brachyrhynchos]XP_017593423.1 PREDICTED: T-complex protein 11-like protein 2 isoform X1 [Corvus brachyrhynchos]XP_017593424.1 PREDICTED: T-complex protein 11-like protein 2 isoform X1 [Corvus brachyrhynchos]XP_017593425.1 PREDICTED: T-complex protein 11-like protein 2 isoform X1 [Corvus brachyrhynchos]XP_017593426.1 PREDICTED: T-co